jgi:hypothetical protein
MPSQETAIAGDGDVVRIDSGTHADCAVWNAANLLIEAAGPGVTLAGKTCAGKAIFVVQGTNTRSAESRSPTPRWFGTTARACVPPVTT